ncbi:MAG: hypothetical protein KDB22_13815 [Planctomycetales bacterium]|nr:hypothetical protein [Planctomycetales bacterium]
MSYRILLLSISACLMFQLGCNSVPDGPKTVPAEGTLTLDGEPVEGASVVFVSLTGGEYSASSSTDEEGGFSLNAFEYKTGAVPGTYGAIIMKNEEITSNASSLKGEGAEHAAGEGSNVVQLGVRNALPAKYQQPSKDFQFTVPEDGVTDLLIELTSK